MRYNYVEFLSFFGFEPCENKWLLIDGQFYIVDQIGDTVITLIKIEMEYTA